jgi:hypothetical protein
VVDGVVSTRTSNEVGRNRHRPETILVDVRRRAALGAGVPELALKAEGAGRPTGSSQEIHSKYTRVWTFGVDDKITGWASFPTRAPAFAHAGLKETV